MAPAKSNRVGSTRFGASKCYLLCAPSVTGYSHGVYIDESGLSDLRLESVTSLWVSAAVSYPFEYNEAVWTGVQHIVAKHFRPGIKEIKGTGTPSRLRRESALDDVSGDLVDLLKDSEGLAWVSATHRGVNPMPDRARKVLLDEPKDIARQLLFERLNRYIGVEENHDKHLLIWDLSHQQELDDFSRFVSGFHDGLYANQVRTPLMAGALLGGLSHDWAGLQVADWFAHMGMHYYGRTGKWGSYEDEERPETPKSDARQDKADSFRNVLWKALQYNYTDKPEGVGYKIW